MALAYVRFLQLTTRVVRVREEARDALRRENRRFIYAFWHQRQLYFPLTHENDNLSVLISRSADGQLIADLIAKIGVSSVRGSSSRNAVGATKEMIDTLRGGKDIGITPDGPKGPAREVKEGVIFLARTLGIPILPVATAGRPRLVIRGAWDRLNVPLPFGRSALVYGEPISVGPQDDAAAKAAELKAALDRITEEADRLVS